MGVLLVLRVHVHVYVEMSAGYVMMQLCMVDFIPKEHLRDVTTNRRLVRHMYSIFFVHAC